MRFFSILTQVNLHPLMAFVSRSFCSLTPLRIPHHPGEILEVVVTEGNQGDSTRVSVTQSSIQDIVSVTRDVGSLRISETGDNQTLIVRSQGHLSARANQRLLSSSHQPGAEDNMTQQEQLRQLQQQMQNVYQQMDEILGKIQQTSQQERDTQQQVQQVQQVQSTQRLMKSDIDTILQQTQQSVQQFEQRFVETQQREAVLQTSQQQLQQQLDEIQQKIQQLHQETQGSQQLNEAMGRIQQMDQQAQHFQQQYNQLMQQMRDMEKIGQHQEHSSLKALDQLLHAQYRVQAFLATPISGSSIPHPSGTNRCR